MLPTAMRPVRSSMPTSFGRVMSRSPPRGKPAAVRRGDVGTPTPEGVRRCAARARCFSRLRFTNVHKPRSMLTTQPLHHAESPRQAQTGVSPAQAQTLLRLSSATSCAGARTTCRAGRQAWRGHAECPSPQSAAARPQLLCRRRVPSQAACAKSCKTRPRGGSARAVARRHARMSG